MLARLKGRTITDLQEPENQEEMSCGRMQEFHSIRQLERIPFITNYHLITGLISEIDRQIYSQPIYSITISHIQRQPLANWIDANRSGNLRNHTICWNTSEKDIIVSFQKNFN
jgi:hypothetical protein